MTLTGVNRSPSGPTQTITAPRNSRATLNPFDYFRGLIKQLRKRNHCAPFDNRRGRRAKDVLVVLAERMTSGTAVTALIIVTAAQLALETGQSERTMQRALHDLEALQLVTWCRGRILRGVPTPGHVIVHLDQLARTVAAAAPGAAKRAAAKRAATRLRTAGITVLNGVRPSQSNTTRRVTSVPPNGVRAPQGAPSTVPAAPAGPETPSTTAVVDHAAAAARARALIRPLRLTRQPMEPP